MAVVYLISSAGTYLALDVTTEVSKSRSTSITSSSIQSGASVADGYTISNPIISFNGICTGSKIRVNDGDIVFLTPIELDRTINDMIESQERFTLYGNDLISGLKDVVITNYNVVQNNYIDTLEVSVTVEQVFVSEVAKKSKFTDSLTPSDKTKGSYWEEEDSGDGKKTQENPDKGVLEGLWDYYSELGSGTAEVLSRPF